METQTDGLTDDVSEPADEEMVTEDSSESGSIVARISGKGKSIVDRIKAFVWGN